MLFLLGWLMHAGESVAALDNYKPACEIMSAQDVIVPLDHFDAHAPQNAVIAYGNIPVSVICGAKADPGSPAISLPYSRLFAGFDTTAYGGTGNLPNLYIGNQLFFGASPYLVGHANADTPFG